MSPRFVTAHRLLLDHIPCTVSSASLLSSYSLIASSSSVCDDMIHGSPVQCGDVHTVYTIIYRYRYRYIDIYTLGRLK